MASPNYDTVPVDYMVGGVQRYIEHGILPGNFLTAVIRNDLRDACGYADENNQRALFEWVSWFRNEAPHDCWGSPIACTWWIEQMAKHHAKEPV